MVIFLIITLGGSSAVLYLASQTDSQTYSFEIIDEYPHDTNAFTQGLYYDGEFLYESTGSPQGLPESVSSVRMVKLETGEVIKQREIPDYFAEGLTKIDDRLFQLTYRSKQGFVYDLDLNVVDTFEYDFEGWGLTYDGTHLLISDGSSNIHFMDPTTYEITKTLPIRTGKFRLPKINEMEFIDGRIFANVWYDNYIYIINPVTGLVESRIDMRGLLPASQRPNREAVLNGIAFRPESGRLLVTGKLWPTIFEIRLVEQ